MGPGGARWHGGSIIWDQEADSSNLSTPTIFQIQIPSSPTPFIANPSSHLQTICRPTCYASSIQYSAPIQKSGPTSGLIEYFIR